MKPLLSLAAISLLIFCFIIFLFSCQNNADENKSITALTDSTSITGLTGDSVKLVKTAAIHFKVKDVEQGTRAVSALARRWGGMIYHQNMEAVEGERKELKISTDSLMVITAYTPQAEITARIPSEHLEEFLYGITDLGYYTGSRKMDIEDKSLAYLENSLKQKNRVEELSRPVPPKRKASTTLQTIALKDEAIEQGIANRTIDADVNYSTVNLSLFQNPLVRKEVIANYYISDYNLPFSKRWSDAIHDGWEYFLNFLLALTHLWAFILTVILFWISYRYIQHKRKLIF
jgi:hypothetical protein